MGRTCRPNGEWWGHQKANTTRIDSNEMISERQDDVVRTGLSMMEPVEGSRERGREPSSAITSSDIPE
jgi:hypothetical protein